MEGAALWIIVKNDAGSDWKSLRSFDSRSGNVQYRHGVPTKDAMHIVSRTIIICGVTRMPPNYKNNVVSLRVLLWAKSESHCDIRQNFEFGSRFCYQLKLDPLVTSTTATAAGFSSSASFFRPTIFLTTFFGQPPHTTTTTTTTHTLN